MSGPGEVAGGQWEGGVTDHLTQYFPQQLFGGERPAFPQAKPIRAVNLENSYLRS